MTSSILRTGLVIAFVLVTVLVFAEVATAQFGGRSPQNAVSNARDEGFSTDDVKDVFEGIQFFMISLGVGAALYWFGFYYVPSKDLPRIEFDVDLKRVGENDVAWMVELVAIVKNCGSKKAELSELRFALESILAERLSPQGGSLNSLKALTLLFTGEWVPTEFVLDPGTQSRRAVAVAIPKTVDQVVLTAQVRHMNRSEAYDASKLVRLNRPPQASVVK